MNQVSIIGELICDPKNIKSKNEEQLKLSLKVKRNCSNEDKNFDIINIKTVPSKLNNNLIFKKGDKFMINGKMVNISNSDSEELVSEVFSNEINKL